MENSGKAPGILIHSNRQSHLRDNRFRYTRGKKWVRLTAGWEAKETGKMLTPAADCTSVASYWETFLAHDGSQWSIIFCEGNDWQYTLFNLHSGCGWTVLFSRKICIEDWFMFPRLEWHMVTSLKLWVKLRFTLYRHWVVHCIISEEFYICSIVWLRISSGRLICQRVDGSGDQKVQSSSQIPPPTLEQTSQCNDKQPHRAWSEINSQNMCIADTLADQRCTNFSKNPETTSK
jgi:hypothetical protein